MSSKDPVIVLPSKRSHARQPSLPAKDTRHILRDRGRTRFLLRVTKARNNKSPVVVALPMPDGSELSVCITRWTAAEGNGFRFSGTTLGEGSVCSVTGEFPVDSKEPAWVKLT